MRKLDLYKKISVQGGKLLALIFNSLDKVICSFINTTTSIIKNAKFFTFVSLACLGRLMVKILFYAVKSHKIFDFVITTPCKYDLSNSIVVINIFM